MGKRRLDKQGRTLKKGEGQRKDKGIYYYSYTDFKGKRQVIYAPTLAELRQKESELLKDTVDGILYRDARTTTLNDLFDRFLTAKVGLKEHIRESYRYTYDLYVRDTLGNRKVADIKYSEVKALYLSLLKERQLKLSTVERIHVLIKAALDLAVKDDLIRRNPVTGVMTDLRKEFGGTSYVRHPLTIEQQRIFLNYTGSCYEFMEWYPLMVIMFGTGARVGEVIGLRWSDIDYDNSIIRIERTIVYRKMESGRCETHVSTPKTSAGRREIPMMKDVAEAFRSEHELQEKFGFTKAKIDGLDGFIFGNRDRTLLMSPTINHAIKKITESYNREEEEAAAKAGRPAVLLPHFTCHHIRHTFCTRLCEAGSNIKVIQDVMGHVDVKTTMNVYAEATARAKKKEFIRMEEMNQVF